jgi:uncharacterized protein YjbI with pentapeptide repeats
MIEIKNRSTGEVICSGETLLQAVQANLSNLRGANLHGADLHGADLRGANLCVADLRGADLHGANLRGANLCVANLCWADLRGADLRGADLRGADLRGEDLHGANLRGANLRGADLRGANLNGCKVAWQSHDLLAEILMRAAGDDIAKLKVAGMILLCREKCWKDLLAIRDPLTGWAIGVLREWVQEGDGAPSELVEWKDEAASNG